MAEKTSKDTLKEPMKSSSQYDGIVNAPLASIAKLQNHLLSCLFHYQQYHQELRNMNRDNYN